MLKIFKKGVSILLTIAIIISLSVPYSYAASSSTPSHCLIINTQTNKMAYYKSGKLVKEFKIATGKSSTPTPTGKSRIVNKIKNRPYYKLGIPGGDPRNPLGDRWLGLQLRGTYGTTYAIHGNNNASSIGKHISGGCVRMYNDEVRWLYNQVPVGTTVILDKSSRSFVDIAKKYNIKLQLTTNDFKKLTNDIYKYDAGKGKYLTYINGRKYSQYSYVNKSGSYAFTPSSWLSATGLNITKPTSSNGYKMTITNPYIKMSDDVNAILKKAKAGQMTHDQIKKELSKISQIPYDDNEKDIPKVSYKKTLIKDIYRYDAGKGKYLTYINGKGYSQYSYLNKSGDYAFTPSSWMNAAGLKITMPNSSNGYTMKINNPYVKKYNDTVKELKYLLEKSRISVENNNKETADDTIEIDNNVDIEYNNIDINDSAVDLENNNINETITEQKDKDIEEINEDSTDLKANYNEIENNI